MRINKKALISATSFILFFTAFFILGRLSKEADINHENSVLRDGAYQSVPGEGILTTVSIWLRNDSWELFYYTGSGDEERFSGDLEPIGDYLFLINSDQFDYDVVSVEKEYLLLIDTDSNNVIKANKVSDTPFTIE